jgi:GDP-L-fucose synthase
MEKKKTQKLKIYKEKHKNNIKTHRLKKKPSSNKRLLNIIGEYNFTPLEEGIKKSVDWFVKNYPNVRK